MHQIFVCVKYPLHENLKKSKVWNLLGWRNHAEVWMNILTASNFSSNTMSSRITFSGNCNCSIASSSSGMSVLGKSSRDSPYSFSPFFYCSVRENSWDNIPFIAELFLLLFVRVPVINSCSGVWFPSVLMECWFQELWNRESRRLISGKYTKCRANMSFWLFISNFPLSSRA